MKQTSLKVLLLADSRSVHTERFAGALRQRDCQVLVVSLEHGQLLHFHLSKSHQTRTHHYLSAVPRVRKLVARFQPDIIDAHFASGYGWLASLLGRKAHPRMLHLWGSDILIAPYKSKLHRLKTIRALQNTDYVVADSQYLANETEKLSAVKQLEVIPWGIEKDFLKYHKKEYSLQKPLKIIVPRSHEIIYDNFSIVKSLAPLIREGLIEIVFPSVGSCLEQFIDKTKELVGDNVRYYQPMTRDAFMKFMAVHDVYLSASKSDSSPVSLIEAMALGLIPIAVEIPGVREWLDAQSGYIYKGNNPKQLFEIINRIITENDFHETIRRQNLEKVKQFGIFENNMDRQFELMNTLVESHRS